MTSNYTSCFVSTLVTTTRLRKNQWMQSDGQFCTMRRHEVRKVRQRRIIRSQSDQETKSSPNANRLLSSDVSQPDKQLIAFVIGFVGSTIGSLIGAGGGVVLTPLLTMLGVTQHQAHGTSLCVITVTALISALKYSSGGQIDLFAAAVLASGAILTSSIGARASSQLNARALKRYFGMFLILVSFLIPTLPFIVGHGGLFVVTKLQQRLLLVAVGMVTGFLGGLLGIGGGTINVPVLVLLCGFGQKLAQGTALLAMLIPSMQASVTHVQLKHVVVRLVPALIVGAVVGAFTGSTTALYLPEGTLRVICCLIFGSIGIKYVR